MFLDRRFVVKVFLKFSMRRVDIGYQFDNMYADQMIDRSADRMTGRGAMERIMKITIYVCGNDETLCDGYTDDRTEAWRDEIAAEYVRAACRVIDDSGLAMSEVASDFHEWHGGRHYKCGGNAAGKPWGYRTGLVCCHERDVAKAIRDLIDEAEEAGNKARDAAIDRYESMATAD